MAAVDRADGRVERWSTRVDGFGVSTLAVIDNTVYAGGRFTSISGVPRRHIAALDPRTLRPTPWDPGANGDVLQLLATPAGLLVHGDFNELGAYRIEGSACSRFCAAATRNTSHRATANKRRARGGRVDPARCCLMHERCASRANSAIALAWRQRRAR